MQIGTESNALNHNSDDVLKEENNYVFGGDSGNRSGDESSGGTVDGNSEVKKRNIFQSSIVDNVSTRGDHVKKKKGSMFFTPPNSTPRRKIKVTKQEFVDVEKKENTPGKVSMNEFKTRSDFCGHEEVVNEKMKLLTNFLARKELDVVV
ncbi:uncharacterized protein LOC142533309 isoform X2 [Primulina tabacum]|uniref:uncharacterized protein LOC142533309 isoform X2 n=1 Tax=Primulina tabacum TaxID=48773 RepID=UPI003F5AD227